jgi:hypothetical protein
MAQAYDVGRVSDFILISRLETLIDAGMLEACGPR